jgi:hypothetical protein
MDFCSTGPMVYLVVACQRYLRDSCNTCESRLLLVLFIALLIVNASQRSASLLSKLF